MVEWGAQQSVDRAMHVQESPYKNVLEPGSAARPARVKYFPPAYRFAMSKSDCLT